MPATWKRERERESKQSRKCLLHIVKEREGHKFIDCELLGLRASIALDISLATVNFAFSFLHLD